ncbi:MAG: glycosyltransferase family 39 protein [Candidatus Dadabacteria bacterium]|nr:MAG: glycosyltransferase family 39 protein [Candidatus Dadabacteria bacterium]
MKNSPHTKLSDIIFAFLLCTVTVLGGLVSFGALEFFRHTEADRALIAWEMLQRRDFIVPHLLGDIYLTKPPAFYWILSLSFWLTGEVSEWSARLPSVIASGLFLGAHYLFLLYAGVRREVAVISSAVLGFSALFFRLSILAEIDMVYAFLSSMTLYMAYLSFIGERRLFLTLVAYIFLAMAFLTKGPPVLFFFACGVAGLFVYRFAGKRLRLAPFLLFHAIGIAAALLLIGSWIWAVAERVGWSDLYYHFHHEIINRITGQNGGAGKIRPFYYYIGSLFVGFLPWSLSLFGLYRVELWKRWLLSVLRRPLYIYIFSIVIPSFILFSLSAGKASRYLFPLYPFFSLLLAELIVLLPSNPKGFSLLCGAASLVSGAIAVIAPFIPFMLRYHLPSSHWLISLAFISLPFGALSYWASKRDGRQMVLWLCLCFLSLRVPYALVYAEVRNQTRSCKPAVAAIDRVVPRGDPIYILEMFERWVPYYLKQRGREVFRLSPLRVKEAANRNFIYIIIDGTEERWRLSQFLRASKKLTIIGRYTVKKRPLLLLKIPGKEASLFKPKRIYPTVTSKPYY